MDHPMLATLLEVTAPLHPAATADRTVPAVPGLYSIFVDDPAASPDPFAALLRQRGTMLRYVGKAGRSLRRRLVDQDLRHRAPSTFFRGLGAVPGKRPPAGSLTSARNQDNDKFSAADAASVIDRINRHLAVRFVGLDPPAIPAAERFVIGRNGPVLNTAGNPNRVAELAALRAACRERACRAPA